MRDQGRPKEPHNDAEAWDKKERRVVTPIATIGRLRAEKMRTVRPSPKDANDLKKNVQHVRAKYLGGGKSEREDHEYRLPVNSKTKWWPLSKSQQKK